MNDNILVAAKPDSVDWLTIINCIATSVGVIILFFYTLYTKKLVDFTKQLARLGESSLQEAREGSKEALAETRKSNEATAKNNEIAERALILGRRAWLIPRLQTVEGIDRAELLLTNLGGVPGVIRRVAIVIQPVDILPETPPEVGSEDYEPSTTVVFPGTPMVLRAEVPDLESTGSREIIVVYCRVEYTDIFRQPWETHLGWYREPGTRIWLTAPYSHAT